MVAKRIPFILLVVVMMVAVAVTACGQVKPEVPESTKGKLPEMMTWTSYDVGSGLYVTAAALSDTLIKQTGTRVRILPSGTSVGRLMPLTTGVASYAFAVDETYFSTEGLYEFAGISWGPQDYRVLNNVPAILVVLAAKDTGVKTPYDFKGKKVAWVVAAPSLYVKMEAALAFGGLTWNDVTKVEFPSYAASIKGLIDGSVDIAVGNPVAPVTQEVAASPRGLIWPEFPASDKEGWARLQKVAPWMSPAKSDQAVGLKPGEFKEFTQIGSPQILTKASQSAEEVYALVKAIDEYYPLYKNAHPLMVGLKLDLAGRTPAGAPFHEGAIKYLKEKGLWKAADEQWNNGRIERMKKLKQAWETVIAESTSKGIAEKDFASYWLKRRVEIVGN